MRSSHISISTPQALQMVFTWADCKPHLAVNPTQFKEMADSFYKLEDEAFPSFLCKSLDSTSGRATLGNVTLGSGPGLPVAASTVAKIRPVSDNRWGAGWDRCDLL